MTGAEHYRLSEQIMADLHGKTIDAGKGLAQVLQAQVHATLALFDHVREIGDQLDARDRFARMARS